MSPAKPRFLKAAEAAAARVEGVTAQDILAQDAAGIRASTYPRPECLQPDDVQAEQAGTSGIVVRDVTTDRGRR